MNRLFLRKVGILSLVLVVSLNGCKFPWDKDKDDSGGGGTPADNSPTVSITNPANGSTVSGTVNITADASDDNGISKVEFYIDGSLKSTDTSSPYSYSWDTTAKSDGSHAIKVTAHDTASQTTSDQYLVAVNNIDETPTVSITNPVDSSTVSGTVSVTADASDDKGISKVEFYVDGTLKATDTSSPYSYSWDTTAESESVHIVKVIAYDTANQTANDQHSVTVDNLLDDGEWKTVDSDLLMVGTGGGNYLMWPRDKNSVGCNNNETLPAGAFSTWAENLIYKGYSDWRLPTKDELKNLFDYGRSYITYTNAGYWSSTECPSNSDYAYYVSFMNGCEFCEAKWSGGLFVRAVRASQ